MTPEDPEPRRCKVCGTGRLSLQHLAQRLGLHRLLELPRVPLHPPARRRGRRRATPRAPTASCSATTPAAASPVTLRVGPYGLYVQLGEADGRREAEARLDPQGHGPGRHRPRAGARRCWRCRALIGPHPEDGAAGRGRHRPLRPVRQARHAPTPTSATPRRCFTIGMNRAVELLAQKAQRGGRGAAAKPLRELGEHPDGGAVARLRGPLRALREVGEGQRHPAEGRRARGADARAGARADRRQAPGQGQEGAARKAAAKKPPRIAPGQGTRGRPGEGRRYDAADRPSPHRQRGRHQAGDLPPDLAAAPRASYCRAGPDRRRLVAPPPSARRHAVLVDGRELAISDARLAPDWAAAQRRRRQARDRRGGRRRAGGGSATGAIPERRSHPPRGSAPARSAGDVHAPPAPC